MAKAYFRKMVPATPVWLTNGRKVAFSIGDPNVGYFATDNDFLVTELRLAISEGRGGVTEITEQQYEDEFVKKKAALNPSAQLWREEVGGGVLQDTVTRPAPKPPVQEEKAVSMFPSAISRPAAVVSDNRKAETGEAKIRPRVGRRPKLATA